MFIRRKSEQENEYREGKEKPKFTAWSQIRVTVFNSWINVLFLLVPIGFALNYAHVNAVAVFTINFVAIIPSTIMIALAVQELSLRLGNCWEHCSASHSGWPFRFLDRTK